MRNRKVWGALLLIGLVVPLTSCSNPSGLDSVQVSPATQSITVGQSLQFSATGTFGNANHASKKDISSQVTWTSSNTAVASVDTTGLATALATGTATITASAQGYAGPVSSAATLSVTSATGGTGGTGTGGAVVSITVIPGAQSVSAPGATAQFLAIGTESSGATIDLTSQSAWTSSSAQIATVGANTGLATGVGPGTAAITALYTNAATATTVTGTATFTVSGTAAEQITALSIIPGSETLSASGQSGQLIALGTSGSTGLLEDVTTSSQLKWTSSIPTIATVNATGLATGVSPGSVTIVAEWTNTDGSVVTGTVSIAVSSNPPPEPLLSLTIIPGSITVGNLQDTGQFLAIGTFSTAPYVRDLTNTVQWLTSAPNVFPVSSNNSNAQGQENAGVASAWGNGSATIIAEATAPDGSVQTATATFSCPLVLPDPTGNPPTPGSCYPGTQAPALLATLTVYNEGLNTTNWQLTAPSATGTANVLHCGPGWTGAGGSVCTAAYPMGTVTPSGNPGVVLTATGGAFGGWSYNCIPSDANGNYLPGPVFWTAGGPNYCVASLSVTYLDSHGNPVTVDGVDETIGAIFN